MRTYLIVTFCVVQLIGCNSSEHKESNKVNVNKKQQSKNKIHKSKFDLSTFPKEWIRLTETDSGLIVFNSCAGGNLLIDFTLDQDTIHMKFHGQQEDHETYVSRSEFVDSTFIEIETGQLNDPYFEIFRIKWIEQEKELTQWITYRTGLPPQFDYFVSKNYLTNYEEYDQPCIECWSKEDCDEFEKNNRP